MEEILNYTSADYYSCDLQKIEWKGVVNKFPSTLMLFREFNVTSIAKMPKDCFIFYHHEDNPFNVRADLLLYQYQYVDSLYIYRTDEFKIKKEYDDKWIEGRLEYFMW